jgi:hypothetical protein
VFSGHYPKILLAIVDQIQHLCFGQANSLDVFRIVTIQVSQLVIANTDDVVFMYLMSPYSKFESR